MKAKRTEEGNKTGSQTELKSKSENQSQKRKEKRKKVSVTNGKQPQRTDYSICGAPFSSLPPPPLHCDCYIEIISEQSSGDGYGAEQEVPVDPDLAAIAARSAVADDVCRVGRVGREKHFSKSFFD